MLLYGPPGTGKTLLARAVAHHTDCTFIRVSGSELVQKYIGEGSRMVRELFVMARCAAFRLAACTLSVPGPYRRSVYSKTVERWCGLIGLVDASQYNIVPSSAPA